MEPEINNENEEAGNQRQQQGNQQPEFISKDEFNNWLMSKVARHSTMISRMHGEKIIQYLRDVREKGLDSSEIKSRFSASFRFQVKKRKFQLIRVVGLGDILCMPMTNKTKVTHAMLGQHRQVIFKEDMFDVIDNAHKYGGEKHRGYKGTFKKISATYCNIPREIVHKYVSMCRFCQKTHACYIPAKTTRKKKDVIVEPIVKKKEIEMAFLTRCQIDIIDMQHMPDLEGKFMYIGHFLDHHTKYNVLFALKGNDAFYVAKKLCRYVFSHFGLPRILHSNMGRKFIDDVISWILQLWSTDAHILNGNPHVKRMNTLIQQRQKTIMVLIETIQARQSDASNWSAWLPGIQYSLNTNQFDPITAPAYDSVFNRRPYVYTYSSAIREIPREEDYHELDNEIPDTRGALNDIITLSMPELTNSQHNSILISHLNHNIDTMEEKSDMDQGDLKESVLTTELLNSSTLHSIPLTLGEQYTIIGSQLRVNGHTLQIPIVSLGNNTLAIGDSIGDADGTEMKATLDSKTFDVISDDIKPSIISGDVGEHFTSTIEIGVTNDHDTLHLTNHVNTSLELANVVTHVTDSLQLSGNVTHDVTDSLELTNNNVTHDVTDSLELSNNVTHNVTDSLELSNNNVTHDVTDSLELSSNVTHDVTDSLELTSGNTSEDVTTTLELPDPDVGKHLELKTLTMSDENSVTIGGSNEDLNVDEDSKEIDVEYDI